MGYTVGITNTATFDETVELFRARFRSELESITGARPGSDRGDAILGAAVRVFESLLGRLSLDLEDLRSRLAQETARLTASQAATEQLAIALRTLTQAQRSRRPGLLRSALMAMGGFLAGVSAGAVEGATSAIVSNALQNPQQSAAENYGTQCFALDLVFDEEGVYVVGADIPSSGEPDADPDELDEELSPGDAWLTIPQSSSEYWVDGVPLPDGQMWRDMGFAPETAIDWSGVGLTVEEALRWTAHRFDPVEAAEWINESRSRGLTPFEPAEASEWEDQRFTAARASAWASAGFEPEEASAWFDEVFDSEEASDWAWFGFDPRTAGRARESGLSPAEASRIFTGPADPQLFDED